jgi:hypothetical protein
VPQATELSGVQRGDLQGRLTPFWRLRFPRADIWSLLRRDTVLSELLEASPTNGIVLRPALILLGSLALTAALYVLALRTSTD